MPAYSPSSHHSPDRIEREAKALAAVKTGQMSQRQAAAAFDVPRGTLINRLEWLNHPDREERVQRFEEQILNHTLVVAEAAMEELGERVTDPEQRRLLTTKELVPIAGMAQDKLALRRNWGKTQPNQGQGVSALAAALQQLGSGKVSVSQPDGSSVSVEVTSPSSVEAEATTVEPDDAA